MFDCVLTTVEHKARAWEFDLDVRTPGLSDNGHWDQHSWGIADDETIQRMDLKDVLTRQGYLVTVNAAVADSTATW